MKVSKTGQVKCEKGEVRVGNFFVKVEANGMVKITEVSSMMVHRISGDLPIGTLLTSAVNEKFLDFLHSYCSVMWLCSTVVPIVRTGDDGEEYNFWSEIYGVLSRAADQAKAVYGMKDAPTEEEEKETLEGLKDAVELEEEIKGMEVSE